MRAGGAPNCHILPGGCERQESGRAAAESNRSIPDGEGLEALGEMDKIGPCLKPLVEKATSPDPSKRHRTVEDFYEEMLDASIKTCR